MVVSLTDKAAGIPKLSLSMPPIEILLVEDDQHDAHLIRRSLNQIAKIFWEDTIEAGLRAANQDRYDLILLSLNLDGQASLEGFKTFRQEVNDAPLIVLTEPDTKLLAEAAINQGAMAMLEKSLIDRSDYLVKMITSFMIKAKFIRKAEELIAKSEKESIHRVSTWSLTNILDHKQN